MTLIVKLTAYAALASLIRLLSMTHFSCKAMPTNDTNYSCHIEVVELV